MLYGGSLLWQTGRFKMPSASYGLRHPASASCLGRHARLAGRCPNNSSLFPPLAAVVVVALWAYSAEFLFYFAFGATAFAERSVAMEAPVGLLSGRAVCVSRWRGFAPTSSADAPLSHFHGWGRNGKRHLQRLLPAEAAALRRSNLALSVCSLRSHPPLPRGEALAKR